MTHTYEVCLVRATIYAQTNTFSSTPQRLPRGARFDGRAVNSTWVQRDAGGYVHCSAVRDLGLCETERRMEILQREIQAINVRLDEQADALMALLKERTVGE